MHLELFKALKSINIEDDAATEVVKAMEGYFAMEINQAIQPLLSRLDSMNSQMNAQFGSMQTALSAKIDAMAHVKNETDAAKERQAQLARWIVGTLVAGVAATLGVLKALGRI